MIHINYYLKGSFAKSKLEILKKSSKKDFDSYQQKPLPLLLSVAVKGQRILLALEVSIPPKFWDTNNKRVKELVDLSEDLKHVNKDLADVEKKIRTQLNEILRKGNRITSNTIRKILQQDSFSIEESNTVKNIDTAFNLFLVEHKNFDGHPMRDRTKKKYITLRNELNKFVIKYYKAFELEDINKSFIESFIEYLYNDKGNIDNTVTKYIQTIKTIINYLIGKGIKINPECLKIKIREYESPIIVLELSEVMKLYNWKFDDEIHSKVRDVFIFMTWTGQRYSDILDFTPEQLSTHNGIMIWKLTTLKTRTSITVPITHYAKAILDKYEIDGYKLPKFPNQFFNNQLKVIFKIAELDRLVPKVKCIRGITKQTSLPLHKAITSHVGRKTFITNALILGMSETEVKKISGHKDDKSFRRYVELGNSVIQKANEKFSEAKIDAMIKSLGGNKI